MIRALIRRFLWPAELVDAVRRILAFRAGAPAVTAERQRTLHPRRSKKHGSKRRRLDTVGELSAQGHSTPEIARRTGVSQDAVAMLLRLHGQGPAESAAEGTFFRILEARTAA